MSASNTVFGWASTPVQLQLYAIPPFVNLRKLDDLSPNCLCSLQDFTNKDFV